MPDFKTLRRCIVAVWAVAASLALGGAAQAACELRGQTGDPGQFSYQKGQPDAVLDAYFPQQPQCTPRPVIIFAHGGSWRMGDKKNYTHEAQLITRQPGFVVMSINYPLNGNPQQSSAAMADAVCWVKANAARLGVDPAKVALAGASAGGQMAVAVATRAAQYQTPNCTGGVKPTAGALILYNPILDFATWTRQPLAGDLNTVNPIALARQPLPPTLIMQGTADQIAPIATARQFVQVAKAAGNGNVQLIEYANEAHSFYRNAKKGNLRRTTDQAIAFLAALNWH